MSLWALFLHLANFVAPALVVALFLSGFICWRTGCGKGRWWRVWIILALAGVTVLAGGVMFRGRDGTLAAYAVMTLLMGLLAAWLARPKAGRKR